jgi:3'(2'), 5'-bisphosphate nucleotidase
MAAVVSDPSLLLAPLVALIREAGRIVMKVRATDFDVDTKGDESPVTAADRLAERAILDGLRRLAPGLPVVAEEAAAAGHLPDVSASFWLVDPVDGTKEFVRGNGEFTVNIALVECGRPRLGLVLAPALDRLFAGGEGLGAWVEDAGVRRPIAVREVPEAGLTVLGSRWHGDDAAVDAFLAGRRVAERVAVGSSLKLCLLAEGAADVYPRFGRTMEWDIAAGDAVLRAAGGAVRTLDGEPLRYGKPGFENPDFVAWGGADGSPTRARAPAR